MLLSQDTVAPRSDAERPIASALEALSKRDILAEFRGEIAELVAGVPRAATPVSPLVARMISIIEQRYAEPLTLDVLAAVL